jgi:hypothetical protein
LKGTRKKLYTTLSSLAISCIDSGFASSGTVALMADEANGIVEANIHFSVKEK